jgi:hypothetical protein
VPDWTLTAANSQRVGPRHELPRPSWIGTEAVGDQVAIRLRLSDHVYANAASTGQRFDYTKDHADSELDAFDSRKAWSFGERGRNVQQGPLDVKNRWCFPLSRGESPLEAHRGRPGAEHPGAEGRPGKRVVTMEQQRTIVAEITPTAGSERCACRWMGFHRSAVRYVTHRPDDHALRQRLCELAEEHPRWGSPRLIWRLRQEGVRDNHKRLRRLYRLEGLAVRRRRRKRVAMPRIQMPTPTRPNERWSMGKLPYRVDSWE